MLELFYFDKSVKKGNGDIELVSKIKKKPIWIDATNLTREEAKQLKETFDIHQLTIDDLMTPETRIKVEEFPNYLLSVFYSIKKSKSVDMYEIDFILGKNFIISNHKEATNSFSELKMNEARLGELFARGVEAIFHELLDKEIDNFIPVLSEIEESIGKMEGEIAKKPREEQLFSIQRTKRAVARIKKFTFTTREKLSDIAKEKYPHIPKKTLPYFRDLHDKSIRIYDFVDDQRESIESAFEIYMSAVSNSTNEIMKTLSIIATIALPLTVISGIYGTNFEVLPGSESELGFLVMIGGMILLATSMLLYFKRKKWFNSKVKNQS